MQNMKPHILITRPLHQAYHTATSLEKSGKRGFILPLTEILPLDVAVPQSSFDALIVTSANVFMPQRDELNIFHSTPLFCVGEQTSYAALSAGFHNIATIAKNAEELAISLKSQRAQNFLYLAGQTRRPTLEQAIQAQGKTVTVLEVYKQCPIPPSLIDKKGLPSHFDFVLCYSAMAAQATISIEDFFNETTQFLCLSSRIAAALPQKFHSQSRIAKSPDEASLLEQLSRKV